ncbi:MAG TPA: Zn-binding domain-containing protein, partial [Anaerolineales bacterium]|nr:Zn-binding domain-containing protein [Anaerolineales bacterium]
DIVPLEMPPSQLQTTGYWLSLEEATVDGLREIGLWTNDPNDYGPGWDGIRRRVRARDGYRCQNCGIPENGNAHHVHHKTPFRAFPSAEQANRLENLATLCPSCHQRAEAAVRVRSGLAGLAYTFGHLAPLYLMCDSRDLGIHSDPQSPAADGKPTVTIFDRVPGGIGLSDRLYEIHAEIVSNAVDLVENCPCDEGCPSCVGPPGELGFGGKAEALALLKALR